MSRDTVPPVRSLVVKVTVGAEALERCHQAFTVAATAAAAGASVSVWLTAEASWLALPGRAESLVLPHSPPLSDLRDAVLASGRITVCTQCAARRGINGGDVVSGIQIAGAATFVDEVLAPDVQALVY